MKNFINEYVSYLKKYIKVSNLDSSHQIVLPFEDHFGDSLACYVDFEKNGTITISDDKYTINTLVDSGMILSQNRIKTIEKICIQNGVIVKDNEIYVKATQSDLPAKVHTLAMTMLKIDDMYLLNQNRVLSFFLEDVQKFFDDNKIFYTSNISFTGKSGFPQQFDFTFQRNEHNPERLCKVINKLSRAKMESTIFAWTDVEVVRNKDSECFVILNDDTKINEELIVGLSSYGIRSIKWSKMQENIHLFT